MGNESSARFEVPGKIICKMDFWYCDFNIPIETSHEKHSCKVMDIYPFQCGMVLT